jgi:hypothetical protein
MFFLCVCGFFLVSKFDGNLMENGKVGCGKVVGKMALLLLLNNCNKVFFFLFSLIINLMFFYSKTSNFTVSEISKHAKKKNLS